MSKGLAALKTIRHIHDMECGKDESINKDFETIEKELKALEIIKEYFKFHHIGTDTGNKTFHIIAITEKLIPAEEYYLLKEVL